VFHICNSFICSANWRIRN